MLDKSLVRSVATSSDEPRFAMLATIREYALERLNGSPDGAAFRRRHAEHYAELAAAAANHLTSTDSRHWLDLLEQDHDNLRAAIDWAFTNGEVEICLGMAASLWWFWQIRGHLVEARDRLERILAMPGVDAAPVELLARAEGATGSVAYWRGDIHETSLHYGRALEFARRGADRRLLAESLYNFGFAPDPAVAAWGSISETGTAYSPGRVPPANATRAGE